MTFIPDSSSIAGAYDWDEITTPGTNTWQVPPEVYFIYITLVGGGGGGGGGASTNGGSGGAGGGGGGAGEVLARFPLQVTPGSELDITIGEGGLGGLSVNSGSPVGGIASSGGASIVSKNGVSLLTADSGKAGTLAVYGGASGSGIAERTTASNGSFGAAEKTQTFLGGEVYASSTGAPGGTPGYLPALRSFDPVLTASSLASGGTGGGGAQKSTGICTSGGAGGIGWNFGPSSPAGVSGGNASTTGGAGGKTPGYGGGGGGGGGAILSTSGAGGNGQPGYCLIEWGI